MFYMDTFFYTLTLEQNDWVMLQAYITSSKAMTYAFILSAFALEGESPHFCQVYFINLIFILNVLF